MKNNRTLSKVLFVLFIVLSILVYREFRDWHYLIPIHFLAGAPTFKLGLSGPDRIDREHKWGACEKWSMILLSVVCGFISLTVTSFYVMTGHEEGELRI